MLCLSFAILYFGLPLGAGLVTRAFFDVLTGSAPAGLDVPTVIALFIAVEVVNVVVGTGPRISIACGSTDRIHFPIK